MLHQVTQLLQTEAWCGPRRIASLARSARTADGEVAGEAHREGERVEVEDLHAAGLLHFMCVRKCALRRRTVPMSSMIRIQIMTIHVPAECGSGRHGSMRRAQTRGWAGGARLGLFHRVGEVERGGGLLALVVRQRRVRLELVLRRQHVRQARLPPCRPPPCTRPMMHQYYALMMGALQHTARSGLV